MNAPLYTRHTRGVSQRVRLCRLDLWMFCSLSPLSLQGCVKTERGKGGVRRWPSILRSITLIIHCRLVESGLVRPGQNPGASYRCCAPCLLFGTCSELDISGYMLISMCAIECPCTFYCSQCISFYLLSCYEIAQPPNTLSWTFACEEVCKNKVYRC